MMQVRIRRLGPSRREDFAAVLRAGSDESAECFCTAYHGGGGHACRARFFDEGRADGVLLYADGAVVGWCQCGPWDSFALLAKRPPPEAGAWAVTCMVITPEARGRGLAHLLLCEVLADLRARGAPYVVAFAHRLGPHYSSPLPELPESVCRKAGMILLRDDAECPLYGMRLVGGVQ